MVDGLIITEKEKTLIRLLENKNNTPLDIINWIRHNLIREAKSDVHESVKQLILKGVLIVNRKKADKLSNELDDLLNLIKKKTKELES